ncbi:MAG: hypothetical protein WEB50_14790 [Vicinamibacterales bacterium]
MQHAATEENRPHISWEIRSGGDFGDERLVCSSDEQQPSCDLSASTAATVHLALHASKRETSYLGLMRVPFFAGAAERSMKEIGQTVSPGGRPINVSVNGLATADRGTYHWVIALDAIETGSTVPSRIEENVPVAVR